MAQSFSHHTIDRIRDRRSAGKLLAVKLLHLREKRPLVVALPRGGVPVAAEIARLLRAPLKLLLAKKLGSPDNPELAIGSLTSSGGLWLNHSLLKHLDLPAELVEEARAEAARSLARQAGTFGAHLVENRQIQGRTVVLVDDGFATGATVFSAVDALRSQGAAQIILAVPVIPREGLAEVGLKVEEVHYLLSPEPFYAVAPWYEEFPQVSDEEVQASIRSLSERSSHAEL